MRMRVEDARYSGGSNSSYRSNGIEAHSQCGALGIQSPGEQQRRFLTNGIAAQVQQVKHRAVAVDSGH